ncbi:hypothetical protein PTTG_08371 [Puccinia triticina 1-1 BBBD Race 1]|uniref:Uncharacterized protein n=1 Tax=Puccinia triticina (isolate 1-1 / race 1 (BBBD)) TaxID=630390 RepID=A0A180G8T8_PUCT1|nr:hypothetical protein PTTG_08371 [Puccinia triticina 1-1 BBBD Race 1]
MSDNRSGNRDGDREGRSALNARSTSRGRHTSQPIFPTHSSSSNPAHPLESGQPTSAQRMEALFNSVTSTSKGADNRPPSLAGAGLSSSSSNNAGPASKDKGKSPAPAISLHPPTPEQSSRQKQPSSSTSGEKLVLDDETVRQFITFQRLQRALNAATTPAALAAPAIQDQPSARELNALLHKWLVSVPKLAINGANYTTWLIMVQQAVGGTIGRAISLAGPDLVLDNTKDNLLKTAIIYSLDNNLKASFAEQSSGLGALKLISDTFTLRSCTAHLALVKEMLELKFNHFDRSASIDVHFR